MLSPDVQQRLEDHRKRVLELSEALEAEQAQAYALIAPAFQDAREQKDLKTMRELASVMIPIDSVRYCFMMDAWRVTRGDYS